MPIALQNLMRGEPLDWFSISVDGDLFLIGCLDMLPVREVEVSVGMGFASVCGVSIVVKLTHYYQGCGIRGS